MAKVIGIDLGTTNTVAAIKSNSVDVIQSKENENYVPSVVCYYKGAEPYRA